MQMLQQFNQFRQSLNGQDPNAILNNLISSGKVTQAQVQQATELAKQFSFLIK